MSSNFDFDNLDLLVSCMELSEKYFSLKKDDQAIFVEYIKSEYDINDDFTNLVNDLMWCFNWKTQSDMENYIDKLSQHYDEKNILMVVNSMIDYINDMIEYIEYQ